MAELETEVIHLGGRPGKQNAGVGKARDREGCQANKDCIIKLVNAMANGDPWKIIWIGSQVIHL